MKHRARVLCDATTTAWVEVEGISGCQRCAKGRGCGAGVFAHGSRAIQLQCEASQQVKKNQQVTIEIDDSGSRWLWLVAGAYGLPTLGLIGATLLATVFLPSPALLQGDIISVPGSQREAFIAFAALAGLAGGVFAWRSLSPWVITRLEKGLCLQSARIVAVDNLSVGET
jgi:positive regulator of sigma E activity